MIPSAVEDAQAILESTTSTQKRFNRVVKLVEGFEALFGLELLSTVYWILVYNSPNSRDELVTMVHEWNERKKRVTTWQIRLAADVLDEQGWTPGLHR